MVSTHKTNKTKQNIDQSENKYLSKIFNQSNGKNQVTNTQCQRERHDFEMGKNIFAGNGILCTTKARHIDYIIRMTLE